MGSYRRLIGIVFTFTLLVPIGSAAVEHVDSVSFVIVHPHGAVPIAEPPLLGVFKQGTVGQLVVNVSGPHKRDVQQVRVSIAGGAAVVITTRTEGPIDFGGGIRATPTGDVYRATPIMLTPCGRTEATAAAVYRGSPARVLSDSKPLYIDCSGPAVRIDAPTGGSCVRAGERLALRWTATDDLGIKRLSTNLSPLVPVAPPSFTPRSRLERTVSESAEWVGPRDRQGIIDVTFGGEDWAGNKTGKGFLVILDGSAPPAIGIEAPSEGRQLSNVASFAVAGPAADDGCGLDRIEIGARRRGTADPFRILKTVREFPSGRPGFPTPRFTYRADLPPGTLAPGLWDLKAEAISRTGRRAEALRQIRVIGGPTLAPTPPAGQPLLPPIPPQTPKIPPSR